MEVLPDKFTYPFRYTPHPLVVEEAQKLIAEISADSVLDSLFCEGKMLGVMVCSDKNGDTVTLKAFSGLAGGRSKVPGFAPPVFDWAAPQGYFRKREAQISNILKNPCSCPVCRELNPSRMSAELQDWLFSQYRVLNAWGETMTIKEIFAGRGLVPPAGTGDCAAPKMLQMAYSKGLTPRAMGEFWYGRSPEKEVREQGRFYPSCTGKCGPLMSYMLQGLEVEANPLDKEYDGGEEPEVLYEDNCILVVDKPAGMLSVPGRTRADSLLEWLQNRYGEVYSCHRLDMDTSGVMVFARTMEAKVNIEAQFAAREVQKTYRARLTAGGPWRNADKGTIVLPLSLDYYDRPRQMVDRENGKPAVTGFEVLRKFPDGEIDLRFTPLTGRSHQIRVHAAHSQGLGRPIKGDKLYGAPEAGRLFLFAESLTFRHPESGEKLSFETGSH